MMQGGYDTGQEICIAKDGYTLLLILLMKFNKLYADIQRSKTVRNTRMYTGHNKALMTRY
jgi:hypothetical protein